MRLAYLTRGVHLFMALFVVAGGIVMMDDSGRFDEHPAVASAAEAIRGVGSAELSGPLEEVGEIKESVERIAGSFTDLADALN